MQASVPRMGGDLESDVDDILRDFDAKAEEVYLRDSDFGEKPGEVLGHFTLQECLGEGGFGSVWLATQEKPIRREVALKILKMGMDTKEVLARFEQERQMLALMDHPGISKVLDAGATPSGRPFFAMELVKGGRAITQFCQENDLDTGEKLELFAFVCEAIQHAHRKGVIHRDLKPGNILITTVNGKPEAKVIDFGISKATGENELTNLTLVTRTDRLMGTPAYMSPEQLSGSRDVDTRSDVYSLGVILYELLTGTTPFADTKTADAEPGEWARLVRERTPRKPSTLLGKKTAQQDREIDSQLSGDLDIIVLKTLEPERAQRYGSVDEMAADLQRYLNKEPILARPRSSWYVAKRFTQRNKAAVVGGAGILLALVVGLIVSSILFVQERESRRLADLEAERSEQIVGILRRTFESAGNSKAKGRDTTILQDILAETSDDIATDLADKPEIEAEIRSIIGRTYYDLDEYGKSIEQWERLVEIQRELGDPGQLAEALLELGEALQREGGSGNGEAQAREAMAVLKEAGLSHTSLWHWGSGLLAWVLGKSDREEEALPLAEEAFGAWRESPDDPHLKDVPNAYAFCLRRLGRLEESISVLREYVEHLSHDQEKPDPESVLMLANIGSTFIQMKKPEEASRVLTEAYDLGRELFHDRNPSEDYILMTLAQVAQQKGDLSEERRIMRDAMASSRRLYPAVPRFRRETGGAMVKVLFRQAEEAMEKGKHAEAGERLAELERLAAEYPEYCKVEADQLAEVKAELEKAMAAQ